MDVPSGTGRLARALRLTTTLSAYEGHSIRVEDHVLKAVIRAMGHDVASDADCHRVADELENERLLRPIEPVLVSRQDASGAAILKFELHLPTSIKTANWRIEPERNTHPILASGELTLGNRCEIPLTLMPGYYRIILTWDKKPGYSATAFLMIAPHSCYEPTWVREGKHAEGLWLMMQNLRGNGDHGSGNFSTLRRFIDGATGLDFLGIEPIHPNSVIPSSKLTPYQPLSRLATNWARIDIYAASKWLFPESPDGLQLQQVEFGPLIDGMRSNTIVRAGLDELWRKFNEPRSSRFEEFESWKSANAEFVRPYGEYSALAEQQIQAGHGSDWRRWPKEDCTVLPERVDFFIFFEWIARHQLLAAGEAARATMKVGLYGDLPIGCDAASAETMLQPELFHRGLSMGAPRDAYAEHQEWGCPPPNWDAHRHEEYRSLRAQIRFAMEPCGAIRIDHARRILGVYSLPVDKEGVAPGDGTYHEPYTEELMAILAIESHQAKCLVIGEDLGCIPPELRTLLTDWGIFSYKVMVFEHVSPTEFPYLSFGVTTIHDTASTLAWLIGMDIRTKLDYGLLNPAQAENALRDRTVEVQRHIHHLQAAGLLAIEELSNLQQPISERNGKFIAERSDQLMHRCGSAFRAWSLFDILQQPVLYNLPGDTDPFHPNWRTAYSAYVERILMDERFQRFMDSVINL